MFSNIAFRWLLVRFSLLPAKPWRMIVSPLIQIVGTERPPQRASGQY
jgi:hypothetical protein